MHSQIQLRVIVCYADITWYLVIDYSINSIMHLIACVCSRVSTCLRMRKSVSLCVYAPTCVRPRVCVCPDLSTNLMLRHHLIMSKDNIRGHCHINEPCTRCYYPCPRISVVFTHHLITHPSPPHFVVYLCFNFVSVQRKLLRANTIARTRLWQLVLLWAL